MQLLSDQLIGNASGSLAIPGLSRVKTHCLRLFRFSVTEDECKGGGEWNNEEALLRRRAIVFSSLKTEDEDGRISVSSLKFRTRSSIRPNCLLIRLVRGVIFRGREFFGLFDTNRSAL